MTNPKKDYYPDVTGRITAGGHTWDVYGEPYTWTSPDDGNEYVTFASQFKITGEIWKLVTVKSGSISGVAKLLRNSALDQEALRRWQNALLTRDDS